MNEANQNSETKQPVVETVEKTTVTPPSNKTVGGKAPVSKLSIIAIALTVCLGGFLYYHGHRQATLQKQTINALQAELANLKQTTKDSIVRELQNNINNTVNQQNQQFSSLEQRVNRQLDDQQSTQTQLINQLNDTSKLSQQSLAQLNERLTAMSNTDTNVWLISQANYLVHLAGRKIWSDQDYATARLLLKSADESLAQTNDPSIIPARQAINKDIASLAQVSYIDTDGIIINLMGLSDSLTELPLVTNYKDIDLGMTQYQEVLPDTIDTIKTPAIADPQNNPTKDDGLTDSIANWSSNLLKSAKSFAEKFIQIEKVDQHDTFKDCLTLAGQDEKKIVKCQILNTPITLEQSMYLRENIRFRLFIAAQAVPRHQELIYQRALNDVAIWVNAYFDTDTSSVKAFLDDINNLQHQSISNEYVPEKLASTSELDKLMQTRVRSVFNGK